MKIELKKTDSVAKFGILLVPLFSKSDFTAGMSEDLKPLLKKRMVDFKASAGETMMVFTENARLPGKVILVGLGKKDKFNAEKARNTGAAAVKAVKKHLPSETAFLLTSALAKYARELAEGMVMGNYNPARYQTGKNLEKNKKNDLQKISMLYGSADAKISKQLELGAISGLAVNEVRDMVNAPPVLKTVDYLVAKSKEAAHASGAKVTVLDLKQIEKLKMGGLLGVSRGAEHPPKIVILEHKPFGAPKDPIVIVGKGIIFDSGGYNLKPSVAIRDMQLDMAGAAAIMGLFRLLRANNVRKHVIGIYALTENLIGSKAQKPSDIVYMHSGHSVEVTNTDAEGRLVLGDLVSYASKRWNPEYMVDVATLTGACMIALGERYAGVMGNDKGLMEKLRRAGDKTGELVWPLPLHHDYAARMKSKIADYRNSDDVPYAGASKGAAFIGFFAGKTKWAHLDIAGTAFNSDPKPYETPMATGYGVRLLLEFLKSL
jgi:leucyl aminopeptidase